MFTSLLKSSVFFLSEETSESGIILFTLLIRTILLPVFQYQMTSSRKMQEIQPLVKEIQAKYPGKDLESRTRMSEEMRALYKEKGVKTSICLLAIACTNASLDGLVPSLESGRIPKSRSFSLVGYERNRPNLYLPVLAAVFTFFSTWLSNKAMPEKNGGMTAMMYAMPVMIFFFAMYSASGGCSLLGGFQCLPSWANLPIEQSI